MVKNTLEKDVVLFSARIVQGVIPADATKINKPKTKAWVVALKCILSRHWLCVRVNTIQHSDMCVSSVICV